MSAGREESYEPTQGDFAMRSMRVGISIASAAAMWLLIRFSGRVYAGAILRTGGRVKLREAYRTAEM